MAWFKEFKETQTSGSMLGKDGLRTHLNQHRKAKSIKELSNKDEEWKLFFTELQVCAAELNIAIVTREEKVKFGVGMCSVAVAVT